MRRRRVKANLVFLFILKFLVFFHQISHSNAQAPVCCETVTGPCTLACRQISLMTLASVSIEVYSNSAQIQSLSSHCPSELLSFWRCINDTLNALGEGVAWEGRSCCSLAHTPICQISCITAGESADIDEGCRRSDEPALYNCLQRQNELEECCGQSNRPDCVVTCQNLLRQPGLTSNPNVNTRRKLNSVCERESSVISCVANITQTYSSQLSNPHKFLPCCAEGRNPACREACKRSFESANGNEKTVMDSLVANGCGHPRPDDKMWGCFLQRVEPKGGAPTPPSKIHRLGMDAPKLHCCHRARDETCRRLCYNTFSREWSGSWSEFDTMCLSSPSEASLRACVDQVDEPCELGCEGLNFCSGFNDRPSQLFRRCSPGADFRAEAQFKKWIQTGFIPLSRTHQLPLRNDSNCATRWKAVACALELKPCDTKFHVSQICLSDCVSLLHQCLDFDQFLDEGQEVSSICDFLSPPSGKPCISLSIYSQPSPRLLPSNHARVTRPCQQRPCNSSQICQVNRAGCRHGEEDCKPYICVDGCRLGEVSKVVVAPGSLVRVPIRTPGCHHLCHCSSEGVIRDCMPAKCDAPAPCWWNQRTRIDHGSTFSIDCNLCSCRSGKISCTKEICSVPPKIGGGQNSSFSCACPPLPSPVCGSNGKTYFSHCTARCGGLSDAEIRPGDCRHLDVCEGVFCGNSHRCIPFPRVCLHSFARKCHQYQCVPFTCKTSEVVCDTGGNQHENLCTMANSGGIFNYRGQCFRQGCSQDGSICGLDGITYESECAAEGRGIPKDYDGTCRFPGVIGATCPEVHCRPLPSHCTGVVPPGACCPLCAGVVRFTFSPTQTLQLAQHSDTQLVTVEEMGKKLESLVQTAECRLGIYLGQGAEIVVIIRPRWTPWTKVQLYACVSEAHRLSALVSQKSPILEVDAVLNLLSGASTYELKSGKQIMVADYRLICLIFLTLIFSCKNILC